MANIQNKIRSFVVKLSPKRRVLTLDNAEELIQLSHDMYYNTPTFDKYSAQEYTILDSHARPWTFNGPVEINAHIWMYLTSHIKYDFAGELMLYFPQKLEICNPQDSQYLDGTSLRIRLT